MFAVFAPGRNWLALTRPELPLAEPVVATVGWDAFLALVPVATCGLVALPETRRDLWYARLRVLRADYPFTPLVLATDAPLPSGLDATVESVRLPMSLRRLWPAIQRAATRTLLLECVNRLPAGNNSSILRYALELACVGDRALLTVQQLARRMGIPTAALRGEWQAQVAAVDGGPSLEDLLEWIFLLRACADRPPNSHANAAKYPIYRPSFSRIAERLVHLPIRQLTPDTAPRLRATFRRAVLDPLLRPVEGPPARRDDRAGTHHA